MPTTLENIQILYEDNHIIVVNKRVGDIVQGDKTGDTPLSEIVKQYIQIKYQKPGNVFLGVVHRIDRPTSGIVLFARTSKALERLNEMLRSKKIIKTYWAIIKNGPPKNTDTLIHFLKKNEKSNKSTTFPAESEGSKKAVLHYKLLKKLGHYSLLEIQLETGRHHQIRSQLAAVGCPIKGDLKYGFPRSNENGGIHLHARKVEFIHPVSNQNILITAPLPEDAVWNLCR